MKRNRLLALCVFLTFATTFVVKAQIVPNPSVVPALNEFCASNVTGPADNFGQLSDWVELYNGHTSQVNLTGYYLSNDPNNLKKWKFPNNYMMNPGELKIIWLSGRDVTVNGNTHANFTLDQCKNQTLVLTSPSGAVWDIVPVMKTKAGHTWGRVDYSTSNVNNWRLYTTNSHLAPNPLTNNYSGYTPKPSMFPSTASPTIAQTFSSQVNAGLFQADGSQIIYVKINGVTYDTTLFPCYDIYYTTNGDYPRPPVWTKYIDSTTGIPITETSILRMVSVPRQNPIVNCPTDYLESFCETNTYFISTDHQTFNKEFGVMSMALDNLSGDTAWFNSQGLPASTTVHVEYFDYHTHVTEGYGLLNRPINESWLTTQKGYYVTIDDKNGFGCDFRGNIFNQAVLGTSSRSVFPTLHMKAGGIESCAPAIGGSPDQPAGTGIRDVFMQSLAVNYSLNVNPLHIKPVLSFVNGKYWGVYNLTEVYDKHYEEYYHNQNKEQLDLCFYHNGDASVSHHDGSVSTYSNNFKTKVYDYAVQNPLGNTQRYNILMDQMDKPSLIDYFILNSFALNTDLWNYNIGFGRGYTSSQPGSKWHYYLWSTPAIFGYTAVATNTFMTANMNLSPCIFWNLAGYAVSPKAHNGHGAIMGRLMSNQQSIGNPGFQLEYKNRYMDLLNGPLKCENLQSHLKNIYDLYRPEMLCHENPACAYGMGKFVTAENRFDTAVYGLIETKGFAYYLASRCYYMQTAFRNSGCFSLTGPFALTVDVYPPGAGKVKLNTTEIPNYPWSGSYFGTQLTFKAIPTSSTYAFHHWEFKSHSPVNSTRSDSVLVNFNGADNVVAVFTDKTNPIQLGVNIPTGFTPNGDNLNDLFRPLGSAAFVTNYQMTIWNRWGQEVFRSTDPNGQGWDGKFNGTDAVIGVYAYIISYKDVNGQDQLLKGNVTLTR